MSLDSYKYLRLLKRHFKRTMTGLWKWFLVGRPIAYLFPRARQRLNIRSQEKRNLRTWRVQDSAFQLDGDGAMVYMHIPKTGGTFLAKALVERAGFNWFFPDREVTSNRLIIPHYSIDWLIQNRVLREDFVDQAQVFSLVRHPVPRMYSAFRYLKSMGAVPASWNYLTFLGYLSRENPRIGGGQVSRLSHAAPQSNWLLQDYWQGPDQIFSLENLTSLDQWLQFQLPGSRGFDLMSLPQKWPNISESEAAFTLSWCPKDFELIDGYSMHSAGS